MYKKSKSLSLHIIKGTSSECVEFLFYIYLGADFSSAVCGLHVKISKIGILSKKKSGKFLNIRKYACVKDLTYR